MNLILNKENQGRQEMLRYFSQIPGTVEFPDIEPDIVMAQEEVVKYISGAVMQKAISHYMSAYYQIEGDSDLSQQELKTYAQLDLLVHLIQAPVTLLAYRDYARNHDLTHSSTGRIVRMDKASDEVNLRLIEADDMALQQKALKAIDRLVLYIDKMRFPEWLSSSIYLQTRDLLLWNATLFSRYFPIEENCRVFYMIIPMIRKAQVEHIIPRLGQSAWDDFLQRVQAWSPDTVEMATTQELSAQDRYLFDLIAYPVAEMAMAEAYTKLPVQLFPEPVMRQLWGPGNGLSGLSLRDRMVADLTQKALNSLHLLEEELQKRQAASTNTPITEETIIDIADRMDAANLYARV